MMVAALIALLVVAVALAARRWRLDRGWAGDTAAEAAAPARSRAWRAGLVFALRVAVLGALGAIVLAPSPARQAPDPAAATPGPVVLLDVSRSMAVADVAGRSRLDAARAALRDLEARGATTLAFADDVRPVTDLDALAADGAATDIERALGAALAQRPAGVLLISDGRTTTDPTPALAIAAALEVPIATWTLGDPSPGPSVSLRVARHSIAAFAGEPVTLAATVEVTGDLAEVVVRLIDSDTGEVLDEQRPRPDTTGRAELAFVATAPAGGQRRFALEAMAGEDDASLRDVREVRVRGVRPPVRVLLLEGRPGWDSRFFARAIRGSSAIALTARYRLGPGRVMTVGPAGDAATAADAAATLGDHDVVVLGRDVAALLGPDGGAGLRRFVDDGGALVLLGGDASLPGSAEVLAPAAGVSPTDLPEGVAGDAVSYQPYGRGQVLGIADAEPWRDRLAAGDGGMPWVALVKWLAAGGAALDADDAAEDRSPSGHEMQQTAANPALMRQIADATGGAVVDGPVLPAAREASKAAPAAAPAAARWDHPAVFAVLLALLGGEWTLRRRGGLR